MCNWKDKLPDERQVTCCTENNLSPYCRDTPGLNTCSHSYEKMGGQFFNFCPNISENLCGSLELDVTATKIMFQSKTLKYSIQDKRYDACYHVIKRDPFEHSTGKFFLKFNLV